MKKSDVVKGGVYGSSGKRRVIRRVVDTGERYATYKGQYDTDCVRFEILHDGYDKPQRIGRYGQCTRSAFASWANDRIL